MNTNVYILTHHSLVSHICIGKLFTIGSGKYFGHLFGAKPSPEPMLADGPLRINVSKTRLKIHFFFMKMHLKTSVKCRVGFLPEETYFFQDTRKKVEETYFFQFCPDKTGRNWTKLEKTEKDVRNVGRKYLSYLISYKRLWLQCIWSIDTV